MQRVKILIAKLLYRIGYYLPVNSKRIVFESFFGKQYSCNPKAIYEYMVKNYPNYKMYWSVDERFMTNFTGQNLQIIRRFTLKWIWVMFTAKYWVTNCRMPMRVRKSKGTIYLQTWHGTPLKKLVFDMKEVHIRNATTEQYKDDFYRESQRWDYLISPNGYASAIFRSAFRFDKEIIESGYPRNDILHTGNNDQYIGSLKKQLGIPMDKKVILYAPTWRDNEFHEAGGYKFNLPFDIAELQKKYSETHVVLLRMHYLVAENFDLTSYQGFTFDCSSGVDINDLYLISDLLITDYSSVFFDYANLRRPILFYMYDIESYRDVLRGFYFDIESEAPGPIVKDMTDLIAWIDRFNQDSSYLDYTEQYEKFYEQYCYLEQGISAERVIKNVFLKKGGE